MNSELSSEVFLFKNKNKINLLFKPFFVV